MGAFFAYGPPIGLYLARLGKGRTVRQFLLMNVFAPSMFVYLWINTLGSLCHLLSVEESCGRLELCSDAGFGIHRYRHPAALPIQHGPHCFFCHLGDYDFLCHTGRSHDFRVGDHFHQRYCPLKKKLLNSLRSFGAAIWAVLRWPSLQLCGISALRGMFVFWRGADDAFDNNSLLVRIRKRRSEYFGKEQEKTLRNLFRTPNFHSKETIWLWRINITPLSVLGKSFGVIELMAHQAKWELRDLPKASGLPKGTLQRIFSCPSVNSALCLRTARAVLLQPDIEVFQAGARIASNNSLVEKARPGLPPAYGKSKRNR